MRGPINRLRGITLLELLIVTMLTILVSAGVFQLVNRAWLSYDAITVQNLVQRQARAALDAASDELRSVNPWIPSTGASSVGVQAYQGSGGSVLWQNRNSELSTRFSLERISATNQLERTQWSDSAPISLGKSIIHNITQFQIVYQGRLKQSDGTFRWSDGIVLNHRPGALMNDSYNLAHVQRAVITVTASKAAANGLTYSRTLRSVVRLRNNFFTIVQPGI
jgi:type II secretory pathway pseudopilin PulG